MSDAKGGYDQKGVDGDGDAKSIKVRRQRPSEMNMAEGKDNNEPAPAQIKQRRPRGGDDGGGGGGWMTMGGGNNDGPGKRNAPVEVMSTEDDEEEAREQASSNNKDKHFQDDNDEILIIPDLDEEGGADSDQRIAHAPRNVNRKIPSLAELENDVKYTVPNSEDGYNLGVLLNTLVPQTMVDEPDEAWTFESLLREITDELTNTPKTIVVPKIVNGELVSTKVSATSAMSKNR